MDLRQKQDKDLKKKAKQTGLKYEDLKNFDLSFQPDKNIRRGIREMPD